MADLVQAVPDDALGRPTPCQRYTVGDLIDHIGGAALAFAGAASKTPLDHAPSGNAGNLEPGWRERIPRHLVTMGEAWSDARAWTGMTAAGGVDLPGEVAGVVGLDDPGRHRPQPGVGASGARRIGSTAMAKLRVHNYAVSLDGYAAGPDQSLENPLGVGGERLHEWLFATPSGLRMLGRDDAAGHEGLDEDFFVRGTENIGATIMGRNMFSPSRGGWPDDGWKGWWGDDPVYHHPVFVLTHYPRTPIPMEGGTTFHFVDDGIESALAQAFAAAGGKDVRLGGGAATVRQYLRARLVDELHVTIAPILLGAGERLLDDLGAGADGYECSELASAGTVAHIVLTRK